MLGGVTCFLCIYICFLAALTLLVGWQEGHPACKKTEWWGADVVICLERGADLHMAQLMPLPLTVFCFSKIQTGFTFLVPADPGSSGQMAVKRVCVCVCVMDCRWRPVTTTLQWRHSMLLTPWSASTRPASMRTTSCSSTDWMRRSASAHCSSTTASIIQDTALQLQWHAEACSCREHITNSVIGVSRPPVLDCGTTYHLDYGGRDLPFYSFRQSLKTHLFGDRSA